MPDKVVVVVEDLLAVVVDQVAELFLAECLVNLDIGDLPVHVKAVEDEDHDYAGREQQNKPNSRNEGVIWLKNEVVLL